MLPRDHMEDLKKLEEELLQPSPDLIEAIGKLEGNLLVLGAGGKMGPDLAILANGAFMASGKNNRVIAVSRFTNQETEDRLRGNNIEICKADLLDDKQLQALPDVNNIIYMAGTKFGTTGNEPYTWAMNTYLPGRIALRFQDSRIVAFSTGNVYPLVNFNTGGSTENDSPSPVGEYGQSCLGRERIMEHFSINNQILMLIIRLNYANDFRYGVLVEIAKSVLEEKKIDLSTGYVNVIWQGDANEYALRSLALCTSPAKILNVTGPGVLSVRWLATEFGKLFRKNPCFINKEQPTALLNNASQIHALMGLPKISVERMIGLIYTWLKNNGKTINKPTHYQERKGDF